MSLDIWLPKMVEKKGSDLFIMVGVPATGKIDGKLVFLDEEKLSAENKITAPRIFAYTAFGQGAKQTISTPELAIEWVRDNAKKGADGIKFLALRHK